MSRQICRSRSRLFGLFRRVETKSRFLNLDRDISIVETNFLKLSRFSRPSRLTFFRCRDKWRPPRLDNCYKFQSNAAATSRRRTTVWSWVPTTRRSTRPARREDPTNAIGSFTSNRNTRFCFTLKTLRSKESQTVKLINWKSKYLALNQIRNKS
jgi:hypothetical protein